MKMGTSSTELFVIDAEHRVSPKNNSKLFTGNVWHFILKHRSSGNERAQLLNVLLYFSFFLFFIFSFISFLD